MDVYTDHEGEFEKQKPSSQVGPASSFMCCRWSYKINHIYSCKEVLFKFVEWISNKISFRLQICQSMKLRQLIFF